MFQFSVINDYNATNLVNNEFIRLVKMSNFTFDKLAVAKCEFVKLFLRFLYLYFKKLFCQIF
jgi:hypothetical protein